MDLAPTWPCGHLKDFMNTCFRGGKAKCQKCTYSAHRRGLSPAARRQLEEVTRAHDSAPDR